MSTTCCRVPLSVYTWTLEGTCWTLHRQHRLSSLAEHFCGSKVSRSSNMFRVLGQKLCSACAEQFPPVGQKRLMFGLIRIWTLTQRHRYVYYPLYFIGSRSPCIYNNSIKIYKQIFMVMYMLTFWPLCNKGFCTNLEKLWLS